MMPADKFELTLEAGLNGDQQAFKTILGWLVGADADERSTAAYMLAELTNENVLDEEQLRFAEGATDNIRCEHQTPGIRYLITKLRKALEAFEPDEDSKVDPLDRADYDYERRRDEQ